MSGLLVPWFVSFEWEFGSISWSSSFMRYLCAPSLRLQLCWLGLSVSVTQSLKFSSLSSESLCCRAAGFHDQHQNDADSADEAPLWLLKCRATRGGSTIPFEMLFGYLQIVVCSMPFYLYLFLKAGLWGQRHNGLDHFGCLGYFGFSSHFDFSARKAIWPF